MSQTDTYPAWLLPLAGKRCAAIGKFELKYIDSVSKTLFVPSAPAYCCLATRWQKRLLPIFDIDAFLQNDLPGEETSNAESSIVPEAHDQLDTLVAVTAYRRAEDGGIMHGGILIDDTPQLINVDQSQATTTRSLDDNWYSLSHGAFYLEDKAIAILNLAAMFGQSASVLQSA